MNTTALSSSDADQIEDYCGSATTSRRLIWRASLIYAAIAAVGLLPTWLNLGAAWQVGGLGLVLPGGGFAGLGGFWYLMFVLVVALSLAAMVAWLLMGNLFAPLIVWLGSAGLAAAFAESPPDPSAVVLVSGIAIAALIAIVQKHRQMRRTELARRAVRNAYLPAALRDLDRQAVAASAERELDPEDLAQLRYALDRGLQPVESFEGFDVIEQFQTSALRYQINHLLWALQLAQCHYTPNFHGYLSQAQRNLIDKLTQPKVWSFWRWESLFGNFSLNADPIARDNIMFGGFSSANLALYTANTGDHRYLHDGSLTFRSKGGGSYRHSLRTMLEAGRSNHQRAVYGPLYPCEPKLTYSACNLWGNFAFLVSDRLEGSLTRDALIVRLREAHLREMMCRDGSVHAGRMTPFGLRIPVYTCNFVFALWGWMASAFFPDLSRRVWAILRQECVRFSPAGEIEILAEKYDQIDTGNYRKGEGGLYAHFLILAREQGDQQVAEAILKKLARDFGRREQHGVVHFESMSNLINATALMGRLMRTHDMRRLFLDGPGEAALRGPLLAAVDYPAVLVARATSDGDDLHLVLRPGGDSGPQTLQLTRLRPHGHYDVHGIGAAPQAFIADAAGEMRIQVYLRDRLELRVVPR